MKAIYEPKGKAKEYGNLACNLYRGCGHGCTYCYAPGVLRMDRQEFYYTPQPRDGIIEALKKDAKKIGDKYREAMIIWTGLSASLKQLKRYNEIPPSPQRPEVFLCFTCDPYQPINEEHQLTRKAIEILHENEIAVNILTKGVITDFDLLAKKPELSKVGITLDGTESFDTYMQRIGNLKDAKDLQIKTWVSMEPVIEPQVILWRIPHMSQWVDEFKIGKWNYDKRADDINWHMFVNEAIELLEKLGCKYHIKDSLKKYI